MLCNPVYSVNWPCESRASHQEGESGPLEMTAGRSVLGVSLVSLRVVHDRSRKVGGQARGWGAPACDVDALRVSGCAQDSAGTGRGSSHAHRYHQVGSWKPGVLVLNLEKS
jgi:hypothetical protein